MQAKNLYILRNVCITNNKVVCDGRILYTDIPDGNFQTFSKGLYKKLNCRYPKFYKMDGLCKLTFLANELITRGVELSIYDPEETAIVLSNSASTLETDIHFTETLNNIPSPAVFVYTLPNIAIGEISIRQGWKGENLFFVEHRFNAENIIDQVDILFASGSTELCLTGWTEYLSGTDYHVCLWLVAEKAEFTTRKFLGMELLNDFST
ncbi:hypothetical protein ES705_37339 [subsurface metagenome]